VAEKKTSEINRGSVALEERADPPFSEYALSAIRGEMRARKLDMMQVNIGLMCNQACEHCHLDASPLRTECMDPDTMQEVIDAAVRTRCRRVEVTGGSPELHTKFRWFITSLYDKGIPVTLRTNLTALVEPGNEDLLELLREQKVHIIASLPGYLEDVVNAQRGSGVFKRSIAVIKRLNALGYGKDPELPLDLVYNPGGAFLPPKQSELETDYRRELEERFEISFTSLLAITNMPIGRFYEGLKEEGRADEYMALLRESFNPATVEKVMCRNQITINWDGYIYDCDFNLALDMPVVGNSHIENLDQATVVGRAIRTGEHCFGCTAGAGSSCSGALITEEEAEE